MACGLSSDKLLGNEVKSHSQRENKLKGNCKIKKVLEKCRGGFLLSALQWLKHKTLAQAQKMPQCGERGIFDSQCIMLHTCWSEYGKAPPCIQCAWLNINCRFKEKKKSSWEQTKSLAECSWEALRQRLQPYSHLKCTAVKVQKWNCHIIQGHITLAALIKVTQPGWHAVLWGVKLSMSTHTFCWPRL